jgi:hypothetical protein
MELVRMVCFGAALDIRQAAQLHRAVVAAVPMLPPSKHLFQGSWQQLQECGVELWPEPVAARLQQLQPSVQGCAGSGVTSRSAQCTYCLGTGSVTSGS